MKTITPWLMAMSAFFSLSITGSLYAADRVQVANRAPDQDFARAISWVQREGRSVTDSGRSVAIHPQLAALFGPAWT